MAVTGLQAADDVVKFYYKKAQLPPGQPTMYVIYVEVNGEAEPLISVGKINRNFPAEKRAEIITGRMQKAWDTLPDRQKLSGIIQVVMMNNHNKVYVIAPVPDQPIPGMPDTFMQVDNTDIENVSKSETPSTVLKQIKFALCNALRSSDLTTKDPESKLLDDQKQIAKQYFAAADANDLLDATRKYFAAIIYNPEYIEAYESAIALNEKANPDLARAVKAVLESKVMKAVAVRKEGDNAYDDGVAGNAAGYDKALISYQKASAFFPECATYYWVQSMVYIKKSGLKVDGVDLEDVVAKALEKQQDLGDVIAGAKIEVKDARQLQLAVEILEKSRTAQMTSDILPDVPAFGGSWYDIFTAREDLLKAIIARLPR
jgi:tetratricopeptide (TPR) repeat protein